MSKIVVNPAKLQGRMITPPSKSHTLRAILFGTLGNGRSVINRYLDSSDTTTMIKACKSLGAKIEVYPDCLVIEGIGGKIHHAEDVIDAGNSGIVLRFCAAIGALSIHPIVITGDYSIRHQRPMQPLLSALCQLGVSAVSMRGDGFAPVIIKGPMEAGQVFINGLDSQPVSALLIAAAFAEGPIEIHVQDAGERPWLAVTLNWFERLGIRYENLDFTHFRLFGQASYSGFEYTVPGDFSTAAFPIVAALITQSEIVIENIDMSDVQGDKELINILKMMGANLDIDHIHKLLYVRKSPPLKGLAIDINSFVDAITILAVTACFAEEETHIYNAAVAKQKECNRIASIATELRKMGADIHETEDGLIIRKSNLKGAEVFSYHDHRMAMSLAVAGLGAQGETVIAPCECVDKTFPSFVKDFNDLGANIKEIL